MNHACMHHESFADEKDLGHEVRRIFPKGARENSERVDRCCMVVFYWWARIAWMLICQQFIHSQTKGKMMMN